VSKSRSLPSGATFRHAPVPLIGLLQEKFEDTKGVVLSRKSKKDKYTMVKIKITKGQTMIYKTLHRKLKIERTTPVKFPSVTFVGNNAHA
jgi:putative lipoic acid-binding regulatory protein